MTLNEMAEEYQKSSDKCREALRKLRRSLRDDNISNTEILLIRRKCAILDEMVRETSATAKYLANYYKGGKAHETQSET